MIVKGITIHNTGNSLSAQENLKLLNGKTYLCHFLVDDKEVINTFPITEVSYHTGKGYDFGNLNTLSVEICQSTTESYWEAEKNAVRLLKSLMEQFNLTIQDIYFHNDFDREAVCPHRILKEYGTKENWLKSHFKED